MQHLGCNVRWGAAEGSGEGFFADYFGEAKVCEFDGQGLVEEKDVFEFDVAVDNAAVVLGRRVSRLNSVRGRKDLRDI